MSDRRRFPLAIAAFAAAALAHPVSSGAQTPLGAGARTDLALTIYANGLGLVSDRRAADFSKGVNALSLVGLSPRIIADSLVTDVGGGVTVLSRERRAANLTPGKVMAANVGRDGYLIRHHPETGAEIAEPARLLSLQRGVIARIGGRTVINPEGRWAFDALPGSMSAEPALVLSAAAPNAGRQDVQLRYLTDGLHWRAVYTADWNGEAGHLDLKAWAVLDNATGIDFDQAWVRLVAGQVNRVSPPRVPVPMARAMKSEAVGAVAADASLPARQAVGGYHLYRLASTVSLADGAEVQVALMPEMRIKAERQLVSEGYPAAFGAQRGQPEPTHPLVRIGFTTPKDAQAQPLPGGTVRLYGADKQDDSQFLGEDRFDDTPVGGAVELDAGRAFDVTVKRRQTAFQRVSNRVFESGHQVRLVNGGAKPARVVVAETLPGDWSILDSDRPHERDGARAVWTVEVPAGGDAVLNYRVQVRN